MVSLLFPITVAFSELPTYFGYCMPRVAVQIKNGWLAWLIASFFFGAQHMFLPLIPDGRFMLWRLLMYMPFALFTGFFLKLRPTLIPYFMIVHALADFSAVAVYLFIDITFLCLYFVRSGLEWKMMRVFLYFFPWNDSSYYSL